MRRTVRTKPAVRMVHMAVFWTGKPEVAAAALA
jgi:hypothetical protein